MNYNVWILEKQYTTIYRNRISGIKWDGTIIINQMEFSDKKFTMEYIENIDSYMLLNFTRKKWLHLLFGEYCDSNTGSCRCKTSTLPLELCFQPNELIFN